jgi:hypothetical protein
MQSRPLLTLYAGLATSVTHIVEDDADKEVEGDTEAVDNGGADLLRDIVGAHGHHGGPEYTHDHLQAYHVNSKTN